MAGDDEEASAVRIRASNGRPEPEEKERSDDEAKKERKEEIRHLEKEAFQLANYYFVFQGVVFTAFYHAPSRLKCRYNWVPMALSALAGLLNLCAFLKIALKYKSCLDDADTTSTGEADSIAVKCARWWRSFYLLACTLVVLAFLAVTLAGCWFVTCSANDSSAPAAEP